MAESNWSVIVAVGTNLGIAAAKFVASGVTGSASMLAEGVHSVVDAVNDGLLLLGQHRARRPADAGHPFGHGKELYFWSLIVAVTIFGVAGGITIVEGVERLLNPEPMESYAWNYGVLALAAVLEGYSLVVSYRSFRQEDPKKGFLKALRTAKDPTNLTVLAENGAALVGLGIAFVGVLLDQVLDRPEPDAIASILIGVVLAAVAILLANESRALLIGESTDPEEVASIQNLVERDPDVRRCERPLTMHLGPTEVLVNLELRFRPGMSGAELGRTLDRVERAIRQKHPDVGRVFIEANALRDEGRAEARAGGPSPGIGPEAAPAIR